MKYVWLMVVMAGNAMADQYVNGYVRKDGTYVAPYVRAEPNQYRYDNLNAQGQRNPYTGQQGTQPHEFSRPKKQHDTHQFNRTFSED